MAEGGSALVEENAQLRQLQSGTESCLLALSIVGRAVPARSTPTTKAARKRKQDTLKRRIDKLREMSYSYVRESDRYRGSLEALRAIHESVNDAVRNKEWDALDVDQEWAKRTECWQAITDADVAKHQTVMEFEDEVISVLHSKADEDNSDGDVLVTSSSVVDLDPFSRKPMKDPVKNRVCGHHYEKETISRLLSEHEERGKILRCGHMGCGNREPIKREDLEKDFLMRKKLQKQRKQKLAEKEEAQHSGDDVLDVSGMAFE